MLCTTLLNPASCLIFSFSPMRLRASYVLMGGRLREGIGPSSSASREEAADDDDNDGDDSVADEARAQVTDGEPPAPPCRITSLVGGCAGAGTPGAGGGAGPWPWPWPGGRGPSEEATVAGRPREREEDTYSSAKPETEQTHGVRAGRTGCGARRTHSHLCCCCYCSRLYSAAASTPGLRPELGSQPFFIPDFILTFLRRDLAMLAEILLPYPPGYWDCICLPPSPARV